MEMARDNTLEVMIETEITKCANLSTLEHTSSFLPLLT